MYFLVDEGLGRSLVAGLRGGGHDVLWVREVAPGMDDVQVLAWSVTEMRVLITEDFDYGDLIFRDGLPSYGVVIVQSQRIAGTWNEKAAAIIDQLDERRSELVGNLTVIGNDRTKSRALPQPSSLEIPS